MSLRPDQIQRAMEPLRIVDLTALEEIAAGLKQSKNKRKRAVGAFLDRINRYRMESGSPPGKSPAAAPIHDSGLLDLTE